MELGDSTRTAMMNLRRFKSAMVATAPMQSPRLNLMTYVVVGRGGASLREHS
jgi:hypothetical protein